MNQHTQKKLWSFAYFTWGLTCLQSKVSVKVLAEASEGAMIQFWELHGYKSEKKKFFLIPERILKIDCSHPTPEIPLLKCLPSALTLLFPSCPAGFQPFVSNWCFMYLDYRSASLRKRERREIMHSSPVKSGIQCVFVRVCAWWATLLSVREKKGERRGL